MTPIALLIAADLALSAPDRRSDAYLFDLQLDILRQGFGREGFNLEPVDWSHPAIDMQRFGAVLVRCAWDYQDRPQEFLARLDELQALGLPVFNQPALAARNITKTYLRDFESWGAPIIPTLWPEHPAARDVARPATRAPTCLMTARCSIARV